MDVSSSPLANPETTSIMISPGSPDLEPGPELHARLSRPARSTWRKVAAPTLLTAILATLLFILHDTQPRLEDLDAREPSKTNITSQHGFVDDYWLSVLDKRDETYEKAVKKGHWLVCLMNMLPSQVSPQDPWTNFAALSEHGWEFGKEHWMGQEQFDRVTNYKPALEALHIDTDYQKWTSIENDHSDTLGTYGNVFNLDDGVITADSNYSPDYQIRYLGQFSKKAPNLKQWSDVVFLDWQELQRQAGQSGKKVEHFFRNNIENRDTINMIRASRNGGDLKGPQRQPPAWPGWQWNIAEKGAHAIMGTSNGAGIAYFLAQHKSTFGIRSIDRIHAFDCRNEGSSLFAMCLYFHAVDGPVHFEGDW